MLFINRLTSSFRIFFCACPHALFHLVPFLSVTFSVCTFPAKLHIEALRRTLLMSRQADDRFIEALKPKRPEKATSRR